MTITLDELTTAEPRMNQWRQYLVLPPGKKKPVGYPRATTIAKELDSTDSLLGHYQRHTAMGLKLRPDLWAQVPTSFDDDNKRAFTALCDEAHDAGGGNARRDRGTAIHDALEFYVRTGTLHGQADMRANVLAIVKALDDAGFEIVADYVEVMVVLDAYKIAGRMDMVLRHRDTDTLYVGDLKTGSTVKYGALAWATQLSIYANADNVYEQGPATDGSEDQRFPMPDVDKERAVIVHRNEDDDSCDVYWLDISAGREALDLAMSVRGIKKRKGLLTPIAQGGTDSTAEAVSVSASAVGAVEPSTTRRPAELDIQTAAHKVIASKELIDDADAVKRALESSHTLPKPPPVERPEEGGLVPDADYDQLQADGKASAKDVIATMLRWRNEARRTTEDWTTTGGYHTVRRVAISRAALALARFVHRTVGQLDDSDNGIDITARAVLEEVLDPDDIQTHPVGKLLGLLTPDQATRLKGVCDE